MTRILKILFILVAINANTAKADTFLKVGLGTGHSGKDTITESKLFSIGYQMPFLMSPFVQQLEGGVWTDSREDLGRKSSGFIGYSLGLNINTNSGLFTQYLIGPSLITEPDSNLGGNFQFNHDFTLGLKNEEGYSIAFGYKHLSSAGIYDVNRGRDFPNIKITLPW